MHWATHSAWSDHFFLVLEVDSWQPPRNMAQYKAKEARWERAAAAALRACARGAGSLPALRRQASAPSSLLSELERLWQQGREPTHPFHGQAAVPLAQQLQQAKEQLAQEQLAQQQGLAQPAGPGQQQEQQQADG
jgi:hypothetical protein